MVGLRTLLLTLGPAALVGLSYATAAPDHKEWAPTDWKQWLLTAQGSPPKLSETPPATYARSAARIQQNLPDSWPVIDHYPFVLTGNVSQATLERSLADIILPTWKALTVDYFDHPPVEPITLYLMSSDKSYSDAVGRLGLAGRQDYAGLYSRRERQLVLNLSTGDGTLAHELTHALAHADFPHMPEWLDEGLAALHEEAEFSKDGRHIIGLANWRDAHLKAAVARGDQVSLKRLLAEPFGRDNPHVDYALARNICLYLQQRDLLQALYRKCRARIHDDPTGSGSLLEVTGYATLEELEVKLLAWFSRRGPA